MTHFFDISFEDAKSICSATATPLPGVGEFRKLSFRNIHLNLNNTGHRLLTVSSQLPPTLLFRAQRGNSCWRLRP